MNELAPCPFCGATQPTVEIQIESDAYCVFCTGCGGNSNWDNSRQEVVDAWNRRVQPAQQQAIPERIADTMDAALIDSMSTRGAMTEAEFEAWQTECQQALDWLRNAVRERDVTQLIC